MRTLCAAAVRVVKRDAEVRSAPLNDVADKLQAQLSRLGVADEAGARALRAVAEPFTDRGPDAHLTRNSPDTFLRNIYGDLYRTDGSFQARVHGDELAAVPEGWHRIVAAHMREDMREGDDAVGIWLGEGSVRELGHPWFPPDRDAGVGVYNPLFKAMLAGGRQDGRIIGDRRMLGLDTAPHELGHAVDHALGWPSHAPAFTEVHHRVLPLMQKMTSPEAAAYYAQGVDRGKEELFAEGFQWFHTVQPGGVDFSSTRKPTFWGSVAAARHLTGYYEALGSKLGIA